MRRARLLLPLAALVASAFFIAVNWVGFAWAVNQNRVLEVSLGLVASGRVRLEPFTQHRFPLERIQEACEAALGKHDRLLKALVVC